MQKNKKNPYLSPEILKNLRFVLGLNKKEFAERIKVSGRYYAMLEDGEMNPSEETAALILKKWGKEIAQIKKQNSPKGGIDYSDIRQYDSDPEPKKNEEVEMLKEVIEAHLRTIEAKDELIESLKRENELLRGKPTGSGQKKIM